MRKELIIFCFVLLIPFVYSENAYQLYLEIYKNDTVNLLDIKITDSGTDIPSSAEGDAYAFKILSKDGNTLFQHEFKIGFYSYLRRLANSTESDATPIEVRYRYFRLPYFDDAKLIKIWEYNVEYLNRQIPSEPSATPTKQFGSSDSTGFIILAIAVMIAVIACLWYFLWHKKAG